MNDDVKFYERIEELDVYFKDLKKCKPMTKDEELRTFEKLRKGDRKAFDKIVTSNLKFVVSIAKRYRKYGVNFADLISEGNLGLIKAVGNFDENKGTRFISYAVWWIKAYIQEYINSVINNNIIDFEGLNYNNVDYEYEENSNIINSEFEDEMINAQSRDTSLSELMDCLEKREQQILILYFGLYGNKESTLDEIGSEMNLTKERVRQIKDKALVKMKTNALMSEEFDTFCSLR